MHRAGEMRAGLTRLPQESLQGFPVDQFVPALVNLLNAEHNPGAPAQPAPHAPHLMATAEMMLLACRSLTHLIDILPAACAPVVHNQAVPALCAKLLNIEYIDLAEQAMSALEKLSVEHGGVREAQWGEGRGRRRTTTLRRLQAVLKGGGLGAVLSYLDFFPTHVQRLAVQTAANICRNVRGEEGSACNSWC